MRFKHSLKSKVSFEVPLYFREGREKGEEEGREVAKHCTGLGWILIDPKQLGRGGNSNAKHDQSHKHGRHKNVIFSVR